MKRLLAFLLLLGIIYGGYVFYRSSSPNIVPPALSNLSLKSKPVIQDSLGSWDNLQSVLGASISRVVETGRDWMDEATDGQAEPIVNRAITNFQTELKQLPAEQVEKIKYDFCKPIVTEYETKAKP